MSKKRYMPKKLYWDDVTRTWRWRSVEPEKFYWDSGTQQWKPEESIRVMNGGNEHFDEYDEYLWTDENARVTYETARVLTVDLMSYLTLIQMCKDQELYKHWNSEIVNLLRQFKMIINTNETNDLQSRIDENLDIIYDDAMIAVLEEVGNSVENGESEKFFKDEISKEIQAEILKAFRLIGANRKISKDLIDRFKDCLGIPEKSPWEVVDFLTVAFHEDRLEMIGIDFCKYRQTRHNKKFKFLDL